ncbi:Pentatricopeptide repeat-containing protein [Hibiscus syriacus]|uniref:Pentatricopeptide repeat-containing protein n=1 Tax=Hibiscus syriacus TaxID=106335 RepID=A0A6A2ZUZ3_HIBSY|nr:pentatricopeptide repeat-containing protein At3g59040-like [Hibiscus syriacus]KAE8695740.1 Pentatricopeptide repeat-containing protein [Hibiscus syriacus]
MEVSHSSSLIHGSDLHQNISRRSPLTSSMSINSRLSFPTTLVANPLPPKLYLSAKRANLRVGHSPRLLKVGGYNPLVGVISMGMLAPRKFFKKRKKVEHFKDAADEAKQKSWRKLMQEIEDTGSASAVLRSQRTSDQSLSKDLLLGTLVRFKQMKKWQYVSEILEWLRAQSWWDFSEMDFLMLITAYGKQGDFNKAEKVLSFMNKKGYVPSVVSHTALMEAYGKGGRYNNAEAIFRRMQASGPEPSAVTYQIILKILVEGNKFKGAEEVFETLLDKEKSLMKPDQKMFHMMIYMHKKAGSYEKARKLFALMAERGIKQSTVTYNSLMSFETNYKEVSKIYDQMQRAGLCPDVVSYALLINAYGKARREEEALAVFEEMLDAGIRPTHKSYNILLDAFAISGMVDQARTVFKSMRRDRYTPDICSYTTMLSAYVNACDMEGAENFFTRLKQDGLRPNIVTYGTLMKGYAKVNKLEKMMETYEEMRLNGIKANQTIFTTLMDAYGKNRDFGSAVVWYKEMEAYGVPPDQKAKNILLSLAKTVDEQKEANQLVGYMETKVNRFSKFSDEEDYIDDIQEAVLYEKRGQL